MKESVDESEEYYRKNRGTDFIGLGRHFKLYWGYTYQELHRFDLFNRPFPASHSHGTKPPCWRAKFALRQDRKRELPFKIMYVFVCLVPVLLLLSSTAVLYNVNG